MIPRLYIDAILKSAAIAPLTETQSHYLKNVLRLAVGDRLRLFNGRDGEFDAELVEFKKRGGVAVVKGQIRKQEVEIDLTLCFAPVKRGPVEYIVQKAVEIGVARLVPVITDHTVAPKLKIERLQLIATEAAEQCGRISVPCVHEPVKLTALMDDWPADRCLLFCDESGDIENEDWGGREGRATPVLEALRVIDRRANAWAVLTGPEGGFTLAERSRLRELEFVTPVTLGPRILRADTAVIAALVLLQAARGDWRQR